MRQEIRSGKYSLIMMGPPAWQIITENLDKTMDYMQKNYCHISVPNFIYMGNGRSETSLYFLKADDCRKMRDALNTYYNADYARWLLFLGSRDLLTPTLCWPQTLCAG